MRFFNKLERRFGRYAIHNLMYYIIIMYVMGFVMMYMDPMFFTRYLSLDAEAILHGQVWRLVTFLLYPPTLSPFWIIFAALMYYSLGRSLEAVWGAFRFNVFFFMGAIGIILAEFIVYFIWGWDMHLNTSYLSMSIFLAYAVMFPEEYFYIYFILAIKVDEQVLLFQCLCQRAARTGILFLFIFFLMTKDFKKYSPKEVKRKQDFKVKTMRPVNRTHHKCAVCGRTDEESPGMEFRYCSKCEGSYEYCMDHLYTHQHVKKSDSPKS